MHPVKDGRRISRMPNPSIIEMKQVIKGLLNMVDEAARSLNHVMNCNKCEECTKLAEKTVSYIREGK